MSSLVSRRFSEWTEGRDTRESMISIFYHIRNIPYSLARNPRFHDPVRAGEALLESGRGYCAPKHYLLAEMYRRLNVPVVFATFPFLWEMQGIPYPEELRLLAARMPVTYHLACRAQIGCRWVLVDATWDPPLASAGFPVNARWDGLAETDCAVIPLEPQARAVSGTACSKKTCSGPAGPVERADFLEKNHWEAGDHYRYLHEKLRTRTPEDNFRALRFCTLMDEWMERMRAGMSAENGQI